MIGFTEPDPGTGALNVPVAWSDGHTVTCLSPCHCSALTGITARWSLPMVIFARTVGRSFVWPSALLMASGSVLPAREIASAMICTIA